MQHRVRLPQLPFALSDTQAGCKSWGDGQALLFEDNQAKPPFAHSLFLSGSPFHPLTPGAVTVTILVVAKHFSEGESGRRAR